MADDLTPNQESFAQKYLELGNASEAYRQSYDAANMMAKTVWEEASRLLSNHKVAARVNELRAELAKRHAVTIDSISAELEQARSLAFQTEQPAAAVSASLGKAKLHGLLIDKQETKLKIEDLPDDQLDRAIADAATEAGVSVAIAGKGAKEA